jgi:CRP/FNR family transcriptional regulator, cyclic AMP receptor protein
MKSAGKAFFYCLDRLHAVSRPEGLCCGRGVIGPKFFLLSLSRGSIGGEFLNKPEEKYRDAVFLITEERSCPIYNAGEELKVQNFNLLIPSYKSTCLHLAQKIVNIVTVKDTLGGLPQGSGQKLQFDCGGCEGIIHFEYKKGKDFTTLQMKMLQEAKDRRRRKLIEQHFGALRQLDIFKPLNDHALVDLTLLLEFKTIPKDKRVVKKGAPGNDLYIILKGRVTVINDRGVKIAEIKAGEIFGEMSLLSGEPVSNSIHTAEDSQVALLSVKNFRNILKSYQILQHFLLKMLVDRAQTIALRSGNITSGMAGKLADISPADLLQMINAARKTGAVHLSLKEGRAVIFFKEGEIVFARFLKHRQKEAVHAVLAEENGNFSYTRGIPKELAKSPPIGEFRELMLEGMQRLALP